MNKNIFTFVGIGILVALPGELINNILILHSFGNILFAVTFYTLSLLLAFKLQQVILPTLSPVRVMVYVLITGIIWGLIFNEWILVGNHPANPSSSALIVQVSMAVYHSLLYFIPVLYLKGNPDTQKFFTKSCNYGYIYTLFILIGGIVISMKFNPSLVLAWSIFNTYFIGYNLLCLVVIRHYLKNLS